MKNIFVGNLDFSVREEAIRSLFETYGTVERVSIMTDRETGRSRGFAFVEMTNEGEAERAISALNGTNLSGRALNVAVAREIPALGSVVAHELESQRRESDTFPTYISMHLAQSSNGAIGCGFLPTRTTGLDLDPNTVFACMVIIAVVTLGAEFLISLLEHSLLKWRPPSRSEAPAI